MNFDFGILGGFYYIFKYFFKFVYFDFFLVKFYSLLISNRFSFFLGRGFVLLFIFFGILFFVVYRDGSFSYRDCFKKLSNLSVRGYRFKVSIFIILVVVFINIV